MRAEAAGWGSAEVVGALVGGVVLTGLFVLRQTRAATPMPPVRLFRSRAFAAGNAVIFLLNGSLTGAIFFIAQYLQVALGHDPLEAGLRLLPWGLAPFLIAPRAPRPAPRAGALADRLGERPLVMAGLTSYSVGLAWLALVSTGDAPYLSLVGPMTLGGIGFAPAIPAVTKAVVSTGAPGDIGKASGAFGTMRQLGAAFGIATLSAAFSASGTYATADSFTDGFRTAIAVAAGLTVAGVVFGAMNPQGPPTAVNRFIRCRSS
ncbi:MFS transporter [Saccharothrix sp. 6-C]|uniref:MFS transporter n=1 Tax=Saccharothrix sp. 6-C TaxID=2781735 RepID=UPI0019176803|nr:MFS transporter [Saccharothrix sp. 6-C]